MPLPSCLLFSPALPPPLRSPSPCLPSPALPLPLASPPVLASHSGSRPRIPSTDPSLPLRFRQVSSPAPPRASPTSPRRPPTTHRPPNTPTAHPIHPSPFHRLSTFTGALLSGSSCRYARTHWRKQREDPSRQLGYHMRELRTWARAEFDASVNEALAESRAESRAPTRSDDVNGASRQLLEVQRQVRV